MPTKKECVGSLLIPASDVQELSDVKLQRRVTVGTLLVPARDLQELSMDHPVEGPVKSLQRRITNKLTGPPPPDAEAESWAD